MDNIAIDTKKNKNTDSEIPKNNDYNQIEESTMQINIREAENIKVENLKNSIENKEKTTILEHQFVNLQEKAEEMNIITNHNEEEDVNKVKKKRIPKVEDLLCESCHAIEDKQKMLKCYICKDAYCKACAEKETHYSSKKRDQSSYICMNCFKNENNKIR